jgi:hypothetical protein
MTQTGTRTVTVPTKQTLPSAVHPEYKTENQLADMLGKSHGAMHQWILDHRSVLVRERVANLWLYHVPSAMKIYHARGKKQ